MNIFIVILFIILSFKYSWSIELNQNNKTNCIYLIQRIERDKYHSSYFAYLYDNIYITINDNHIFHEYVNRIVSNNYISYYFVNDNKFLFRCRYNNESFMYCGDNYFYCVDREVVRKEINDKIIEIKDDFNDIIQYLDGYIPFNKRTHLDYVQYTDKSSSDLLYYEYYSYLGIYKGYFLSSNKFVYVVVDNIKKSVSKTYYDILIKDNITELSIDYNLSGFIYKNTPEECNIIIPNEFISYFTIINENHLGCLNLFNSIQKFSSFTIKNITTSFQLTLKHDIIEISVIMSYYTYPYDIDYIVDLISYVNNSSSAGIYSGVYKSNNKTSIIYLTPNFLIKFKNIESNSVFTFKYDILKVNKNNNYVQYQNNDKSFYIWYNYKGELLLSYSYPSSSYDKILKIKELSLNDTKNDILNNLEIIFTNIIKNIGKSNTYSISNYNYINYKQGFYMTYNRIYTYDNESKYYHLKILYPEWIVSESENIFIYNYSNNNYQFVCYKISTSNELYCRDYCKHGYYYLYHSYYHGINDTLVKNGIKELNINIEKDYINIIKYGNSLGNYISDKTTSNYFYIIPSETELLNHPSYYEKYDIIKKYYYGYFLTKKILIYAVIDEYENVYIGYYAVHDIKGKISKIILDETRSGYVINTDTRGCENEKMFKFISINNISESCKAELNNIKNIIQLQVESYSNNGLDVIFYESYTDTISIHLNWFEGGTDERINNIVSLITYSKNITILNDGYYFSCSSYNNSIFSSDKNLHIISNSTKGIKIYQIQYDSFYKIYVKPSIFGYWVLDNKIYISSNINPPYTNYLDSFPTTNVTEYIFIQKSQKLIKEMLRDETKDLITQPENTKTSIPNTNEIITKPTEFEETTQTRPISNLEDKGKINYNLKTLIISLILIVVM